MLTNITYLQILGYPLIMYLGILALICLFLTVYYAKKSLKWHKLFAMASIILAIIHGILGISNYF